MQEYLNDKIVFKTLLFKSIYKPEDDPRRKMPIREKVRRAVDDAKAHHSHNMRFTSSQIFSQVPFGLAAIQIGYCGNTFAAFAASLNRPSDYTSVTRFGKIRLLGRILKGHWKS